jgi:hypothetical protein
LHALRGDDAARRAGEDLGVARPVEQRRQPADFQLGAALDEHVGAVEGNDLTGARVDEVRILRRFGDGGDGDLGAADLAGDGAVFGSRGDDIERGAGRQRRAEQDGGGESESEFHGGFL